MHLFGSQLLGGNPLIFGLLTTWLTPIWIFAAGFLLGLIALSLIYAVLKLLGTAIPKVRTIADSVPLTIREGILLPILILSAVMSVLAVISTFGVPYDRLIPSLLKWPHFETVPIPEVWLSYQTAGALVGLFIVYFALRLAFPKLSALAAATAKEGMSQPLFYLLLALGFFAILAFIYIPYNTFGEDVKLFKESGMKLIMILAIIVALWTASVSVAEEIEGRTALTVLSKPISRRSFVLGKFLGVLGPVALLFIVLGVFFLCATAFKPVYDAREVAQQEPSWQECFNQMVSTIPGLILAFLETVALASISVAISTRLPMVANLMICATIYVLGHLVPLLVNSAVGKFALVTFVGQLIATVLPVLDHYDIQAAISGGAAVPIDYLAWAFLYCALYSTIAMLLALFLFEDRDVA